MSRWFFALAALCALGCSSAQASSDAGVVFPAAALTTVTSDSGALRIEVRTAPDQPPQHGLIAVDFVIADAKTGATVDGLTVHPVPWMPAHGHGTSITPTVTPHGLGHYEITSVDFYMAGSWQLRTDISGTITDHVDVSFDVR
ncbi:MAG TPA: FixH family protein [Polyangiaceae bacterium]